MRRVPATRAGIRRVAVAMPAAVGIPARFPSPLSHAGGRADLDPARLQRCHQVLALEQEDRVDDPWQYSRLAGWTGQDEIVIAWMGADVQDGPRSAAVVATLASSQR